MKEFASAAELRDNYRDVKQRLPPYAQQAPIVIKEPEVLPVSEPAPLPRPVKPLPREPKRRVAHIVVEHYKVGWPDLCGPLRIGHVVRPRQVFCYVCHRIIGESLPRIGRFIDRDHSTVLNGVIRIEELMLTNEKLAQDVAQITARYYERDSI
jgi:hypothetical protein